jgi:hypothetical protein
VRRGEARSGHPFIGVRGRRRRPGRAGDDGHWHPINGTIIGVKEGRKCGSVKEGRGGASRLKRVSTDGFAPWHERWVAADMARRRAKGGDVLDWCREEERGTGPVGWLACWVGSGKMGQMANEPMKRKKKIIFKFQN